LWLFELFCGHLVYYMVIWYVVPRKIWQPWYEPVCRHWLDGELTDI
jgi:hypothetical protein